jgi:very-short-patch-repair endonuclease
VKGDPRTEGTRARSRALRRGGSDAEAALWRSIRGRPLTGAKFRRQHRIGPYVVDSCCVEARLIVELDGGQHAERADRDAQRTAYLVRQGWRVVRFWNHAVLARTSAVLEAIAGELAQPLGGRASEGLNPSPHPLPPELMRGEGVGPQGDRVRGSLKSSFSTFLPKGDSAEAPTGLSKRINDSGH